MRTSRLIAVLIAGAVLSGCGSGGYHPVGPFKPLPEGAPPEVGPPTSSAPVPGDPAQPESGDTAGDPNVVASGLNVPTGLVLLPDGSAIVGERETGRLLQVYPDRSPPRELMTVPGVDTTGDGGLLGWPSPHLPPGRPALRLPVHGHRQPRRPVPAGRHPEPGADRDPARRDRQRRRPAVRRRRHAVRRHRGHRGTRRSPPTRTRWPARCSGSTPRPCRGRLAVYGRGHRDVTALCRAGGGDPANQPLYATDATTDGPDELDAITTGTDYGSPAGRSPVAEVRAEEGGLGGCAATTGGVFLGAMDGQRVRALTIDGNGVVTGDPEEFLAGEYGRLRTVVLDARAPSRITTSNRDGVGTPTADDDRVLRIQPPTTTGSSPL